MRSLLVAACLCATPVLAETPAEATVLRPNDPEGTAPLWDSAAECSAILAAASSRASSFIDRDKFKIAAGSWFAATFDLAAKEEAEVSPEQLGTYVSNWASKIGNVSSLAQQPGWMAFCAQFGSENGIDASMFRAHMPPEVVAEG